MDFHNVAQLRGARSYVHVLPLCLFGTEGAEDDRSLEEIYDEFATGTHKSSEKCFRRQFLKTMQVPTFVTIGFKKCSVLDGQMYLRTKNSVFHVICSYTRTSLVVTALP